MTRNQRGGCEEEEDLQEGESSERVKRGKVVTKHFVFQEPNKKRLKHAGTRRGRVSVVRSNSVPTRTTSCREIPEFFDTGPAFQRHVGFSKCSRFNFDLQSEGFHSPSSLISTQHSLGCFTDFTTFSFLVSFLALFPPHGQESLEFLWGNFLVCLATKDFFFALTTHQSRYKPRV
jgi:hypothetical protein